MDVTLLLGTVWVDFPAAHTVPRPTLVNARVDLHCEIFSSWICRCLGCWHWGVRVQEQSSSPSPAGKKTTSALKLQKKTPTILGFTWKWQHMLNVEHQPLPKVELFWAHPEDAGRADASLPPPGSSFPFAGGKLLARKVPSTFALVSGTSIKSLLRDILRGEGSSLLAFGPCLAFCKGLFVSAS